MTRQTLIATALLLVTALPAAGAGINAKLELKEIPDIPGRLVGVEGLVGAEPHRFFLENLSILQPVGIGLAAGSPDDDIRISVHKFAWTEPERSGSTSGKGYELFRFRTQGEFQIQVTSPDGEQPYKLFVWAGDEVEMPMPSVVVSHDAYETGLDESGVGSPLLLAIVGLLALIAGLLVTVVVRGGKR